MEEFAPLLTHARAPPVGSIQTVLHLFAVKLVHMVGSVSGRINASAQVNGKVMIAEFQFASKYVTIRGFVSHLIPALALLNGPIMTA